LNSKQFCFKKKLGQNFLLDEKFLIKMVSLMKIEPNTLIIEIGVGTGLLTSLLAKKANHVCGYEIDKRLEPIIINNLKNDKNVKIIYDDFLSRDLQEDIKNEVKRNVYVVGNLPYYITTPIIMKIINSKINPRKIIIMVQKEVGERILAKTGTKEYNSLTVFLNYYYDIKKIITIGREMFIPKPNIDSVLLEFTQKEKKYNVLDEKLFLKLVRDSFQYKRKTLKNNLKDYNLEIIAKVLNKYNNDLSIRAEKLTIEQFVIIANELKKDEMK
ncbi:MAG: 16S rRNA (adenine(1518)-N(6)/adenine(1519)-N(6))-dimethyltransferase RsmA, partial [Bacilli bacterium]|nr:16S rRNA (adenine(1518)-N(6)/adenine(1519)-N(6))-dimethyltransferase RsmA [Bacilli bacterium]